MQLRLRGCGFGLLALMVGLGAAAASGQETMPYDPATAGPPAVMFTVREVPKLGMEAAHEKSETAQAAVQAAAKSPDTYLAMSSITGSEPRVVFFRGYDTMGEIESRYMAAMKIPGLAEKLERMDTEDKAMLTGAGTAIWRLRPDLSSPGKINIAEMKMAELVEIETKPGHAEDFEGTAKRVMAAWAKADPEYHADIYEMSMGTHTGPVFLVILPMKSLAYLDKLHDEHDAFMQALGEGGTKSDTEAAKNGTLSSDSNLFIFSPEMSNLPESWVKYDPAYWKPKPMMMEKKKDEKK